MTGNPSEPQERWEKVDVPAWFGPPYGGKALRISVGGKRFYEREMPEGLIDRIIADHNAALARPEPAAGETGLLEEAATALAYAVSFMAGVYESKGMKPARYEREQVWKWVNEPRLKIERFLEARHAAAQQQEESKSE